MYNETIKSLLQKMEALPRTLVILYLMKTYGLNVSSAEQSIYAACRNRVCYQKGEFLTLSPYTEVSSNQIKRAKAFRVVLDFLPESKDFVMASHPWLLTFVKQSRMIQVCYIENNMEIVTSMLIAEKAIPAADRAHRGRIAIVENANNIDNIKHAGFSFFCTVSDEYNLEIVKKVDANEAWEDVAEK